jgi:hypothetical protein
LKEFDTFEQMKLNKRITFFCLWLQLGISLQAQDKIPVQKLSPSLIQKMKITSSTKKTAYIITLRGRQLPKEIENDSFKPRLLNCYHDLCFYSVNASFDELQQKILLLPQVIFAEDTNRFPREEQLIGSLDMSANRINLVHHRFPQWNGLGLTASVKENKPDTSDLDIRGRYKSSPLSSSIVNEHASIMTTLIAGGGNSWHLGKGAAWSAEISSSNFINLLPDANSYFQQYNISAQNHSYGVGIENFYGADAAAYDIAVINNPAMLHIFSSGNAGAGVANTGIYSNIAGFANLTGSFKMAKNIITVGATDSFGLAAVLSSKGPAHDGRIKPELVAYGEDGSSGAAALVTGTSLLLQQAYKELYGGLPPNALVKAVLLNSADDAGNAEVDYTTGFGSLNAINAVKTIEASRFMDGTVTHGGIQNYTLNIPAGIKKVKITLLWNDPAAAPNAAKALVNDLDLELVNTSTAQIWKPWVLNSFPHIDSLKQAAARKRDSLNNAEQVTLENPVEGIYNFSVKGYQLTTASQTFYIAYQLDSSQLFDWQFPSGSDFIFPDSRNLIRWNQSFSSGMGQLDYSINNGVSWQLISNTVDLANKYYQWDAPAFTGKTVLRMTIGSSVFVSEPFTIAGRTVTGVGFNCADSFLLYWNKNPLVSNYRVYQMGNRYLEPVTITSDSFIVLKKNLYPSLFYAVAPVIANKEAVKSYSFNYTLQGVQCYIRSFFATLVNNHSASLDLQLGSLYNLSKIVLEKANGPYFAPVQQLINNTSLQVQFTDISLIKGANTYRIKLELANGETIYSDKETIYYFASDNYILFPNPALQQNSIQIAVKNVNDARMQVFNLLGEKVFEKILDDRVVTIPGGKLSKGIYFVRIMQNNKREFTGKLLVY